MSWIESLVPTSFDVAKEGEPKPDAVVCSLKQPRDVGKHNTAAGLSIARGPGQSVATAVRYRDLKPIG